MESVLEDINFYQDSEKNFTKNKDEQIQILTEQIQILTDKIDHQVDKEVTNSPKKKEEPEKKDMIDTTGPFLEVEKNQKRRNTTQTTKAYSTAGSQLDRYSTRSTFT